MTLGLTSILRSATWRVPLLLISLPAILALFTVLSALLYPDVATLKHLFQYVLPEAMLNTLLLLLGVCGMSTIIGVLAAWLTTSCHFPLRGFFSWALFLPMAIPGYVMAFSLIGFFEYTGFLQSALRSAGIHSDFFPDIYSRSGVIFALSLVLYPYVYLLAKSAFKTQGVRCVEVGQSMGFSVSQSFFKVVLPMARPWIVGGMLLVMMETLADFGTVSVFNYNTLTTAIYKSWFGLFSLGSALQIAAISLLIIALLISVERWSRGTQRFSDDSKRQSSSDRFRLSGTKKWLAIGFCSVVLLFALILPVFQLLYWLLPTLTEQLTAPLWKYVKGSVLLASLSMLFVVCLALVLAFIARTRNGYYVKILTRLSTIGYAVPGTVLAVGLFVPISWLDRQLVSLGAAGPLLQGSIVIMLLAYTARFMAVAYSPIESNFLRITSQVDMAARSLGVSGFNLLKRVHVPMMRSGLLTALVLVFVDVIKELPITLMTRPFGVNTLAVRVYEFTSEGLWERAALPALIIVLVGLLPVILLIKRADDDQ